MIKFGRNYSLRIQVSDVQTLTISLPFTIEFDITRNTLTSANVCQIRIYNLSQKNRGLVRYNASNQQFPHRSIELRAGYGTNLPIIFSGNITQAWSVREGVNFITQIECYDGGFAFGNGVTDTQFPAGTEQKTVIKTLIGSLPFVTLGGVGDYPGTLSRGNTYSGNTTEILSQITGGGFFVDQGRGNALGTNEFLEDIGAGITVINAASGLLGTPVLEQTIVRFDMIFEPNLQAGQKIKLESITEANFNGEYKVTAVKHRGMISEAVCGDAVTSGEFFFTKILTGVGING